MTPGTLVLLHGPMESAAIWGSSESVTRTCACAAKPATASSMIERVGVRCAGVEETCAAAVTFFWLGSE